MWVAGFYSGASQSLTMGGEPEAFLDGYACGSVALGNAEQNRSRISIVRQAAARARWEREQPKQIVIDANAYAIEDAPADPNAQAQAMHKTDKTDKTRQDTTGQEKTTTRRARASFSPGMFDSIIPSDFAESKQFVEAWHLWVADRHARRKAITDAGAKAQLAKLFKEAVTPAVACQWIEFSIACGYQGIYPPKPSVRQQSSPPPQFNGFAQTDYSNGASGDEDIRF